MSTALKKLYVVAFHHRCGRLKNNAYLVLFGALGQDGSALPPVRPLVSLQRPEEGLFLVAVPQQDPQTPLCLPLELVVEEKAEGALLGPHLGAQQPGSLTLGVGACIQVEVVS